MQLHNVDDVAPLGAASTYQGRILLISDVVPQDTSAGNVVLYRHLRNLDCSYPTLKWNTLDAYHVLRRLTGLGERIGLPGTKLLHDLNAARWMDRQVEPSVEQCDLVMTVAHGHAYLAAMRLARKFNKPLVTFFHDWWPELHQRSTRSIARLEKQFRDLYHHSDLALCVSEGMKAELGEHPNCHVLYPIPSESTVSSTRTSASGKLPFRLCYAGNLTTYGPMLESLARASQKEEWIDLQIRGSNPIWDNDFARTMQESGKLLPFVEIHQFNEWMLSADAILVVQSFDERHSRQMRTNFPSKLCEFAKFGRPLLMWGPDYGSGCRWQKNSQAAVPIVESNPSAVLAAIRELRSDRARTEALGDAACLSSQDEFSPDAIQGKFLKLLRSL